MEEEKNDDRLRVFRRHLPHWRLASSTYFVTFRLLTGTLNPAERVLVLNHVRSGDRKHYWLLAATVMPDHAHLILQPNSGCALSHITKGIKGVSARLLNQDRGVSGTVWQAESFDRIIRSEHELLEKLNYILNNAVKNGLVVNPLDYEGLYFNLEPPQPAAQ